MTNMTTNQSNSLEHDGDHSHPDDKKLNPNRTGLLKGDWKHVEDSGLPPGIHSKDLFDPNGDRPPGVPNGDNS